MTVKPVNETDYYGKGFKQMSHAAKMVGPPRMNFGAPRVDNDRIKAAARSHSYIDSCPTIPEHLAWTMRPREKNREIGPSMRFNSHSQAERLMESLKNKTQQFFTREEVTGDGKDEQTLEKKIKEYNKTGRFMMANNGDPIEPSFIVPTPQTTNNQKSVPVSQRQSRLQRSNFFLEPRSMMTNIHNKTHFKAAISVSRADACCVKVEQNEFGDQFAEIARNIEAMNRSMRDF